MKMGERVGFLPLAHPRRHSRRVVDIRSLHAGSCQRVLLDRD